MSSALENYVTRNSELAAWRKKKEISSFGVKRANKAPAKKKKCLKKICVKVFSLFRYMLAAAWREMNICIYLLLSHKHTPKD